MSLSKRRFPTSQSTRSSTNVATLESIKEAIPNQPKHAHIVASAQTAVYQRGDSQPAKARMQPANCARRSLSKRRFPTSQSLLQRNDALLGSLSKRRFPTSQSPADMRMMDTRESIKEAIPNQPKLKSRGGQTRPESIKEAIPNQPKRTASGRHGL